MEPDAGRTSHPAVHGGALGGRGDSLRQEMEAVQHEASRWALSLFWGSVAFAGFALVLLISSFIV